MQGTCQTRNDFRRSDAIARIASIICDREDRAGWMMSPKDELRYDEEEEVQALRRREARND